jgi:cellulose 1,4-beta-cellobiosidase
LVDAYFWVKPPGESDGSGDPTAQGFDESCGPKALDSTPGAPPAGSWFADYFIELTKNAVPPL